MGRHKSEKRLAIEAMILQGSRTRDIAAVLKVAGDYVSAVRRKCGIKSPERPANIKPRGHYVELPAASHLTLLRYARKAGLTPKMALTKAVIALLQEPVIFENFLDDEA